jgi:predicted transcriptional regulator
LESERGSELVEKLELDFYYGRESDQFTFYRLPKALITDERFKDMSNNAKLLYGLMLDRMSLSKKRGWLDEDNKVFIKYSLNNIEENLNVSKKTAVVLLKELENIGLIDMVKQTGVANVIYVKNFVSEDMSSARKTPVKEIRQDNKDTSEEMEQVKKLHQFQNDTSEAISPEDNFYQSNLGDGTGAESSTVQGELLHPNNIEINNKYSNTNPISLSYQQMDEVDQTAAYMKLIKENIEYDIMMSNRQWRDQEMFDELYQLICEVVCVPRKTIRIAGEDYPYNLVKSKFLKLNSQHLQYVIGCMERNTTKVANIKAYLITALYNAPNTISHYFNAEVNHDMYGTD